MRRASILIGLLLVLAACGDDDAATSTTTTEGDATTTTAAATTTSAADDPVAERIAAAEALAGEWTGEWHNNTFGSTGSIDATFEVDAAAATATLTLDLGGNVFGSNDPDPFAVDLDLTAAGPYEGTNDLLGDFTVTANADGAIVLDAPAVPGLGRQLTMEGSMDGDTITGTYDIPGLADGTFTATRG